MVHVNTLLEPLRDVVQHNDRLFGHPGKDQIALNMPQMVSNKLV